MQNDSLKFVLSSITKIKSYYSTSKRFIDENKIFYNVRKSLTKKYDTNQSYIYFDFYSGSELNKLKHRLQVSDEITLYTKYGKRNKPIILKGQVVEVRTGGYYSISSETSLLKQGVMKNLNNIGLVKIEIIYKNYTFDQILDMDFDFPPYKKKIKKKEKFSSVTEESPFKS